MRELTRSLQDGFHLYQRPPGPSVLHSRYVDNQRNLESEARQSGDMSLPSYVIATWHPSLHNVGILMLTKAQYDLYVQNAQRRPERGYSRAVLEGSGLGVPLPVFQPGPGEVRRAMTPSVAQ